jgi:hypothetical protein
MVELGKIDDGRVVAGVVDTLGGLPSKDEPVKDVPLRVRRSNASGWKAEALAST